MLIKWRKALQLKTSGLKLNEHSCILDPYQPTKFRVLALPNGERMAEDIGIHPLLIGTAGLPRKYIGAVVPRTVGLGGLPL